MAKVTAKKAAAGSSRRGKTKPAGGAKPATARAKSGVKTAAKHSGTHRVATAPPAAEPGETAADRKRRAGRVDRKLSKLYPDADCALTYRNPWELLVATILSAQCTDERVNMVTPGLFERWPGPEAMAEADPAELEAAIRSTGFFRNKAKNIRGAAEAVTVEHGGQTPDSMEALIALPGVARKTANVVLGNAMGINAGVCVDTHVGRLSRRLGLTEHEDPVKVERDLMDLFPRKRWTMIAHLLIWHGRRVCQSRKPACDRCELVELCPKIGVAAAT